MRTWNGLLIGVGVALGLVLVVSPVAARGLNAPVAAMSTLTATLSGAAEVPDPGDTDGAGTASVTVDTAKNEVCATFKVSNIVLPAAAAHIHKGAAGVAGPVVVPLAAPDASGASSVCATADAALVADIAANPAGYYANVHSSEFPNGAIRGQLSLQSAPQKLPNTGAEAPSAGLLAAGALLLLAGAALLLTLRRSAAMR